MLEFAITFAVVMLVLIGVYCWGYSRGFEVGKKLGEITIDEGLGSVLRWVNSSDILPQDEDEFSRLREISDGS